jgi:serine/threonine protein kinase
VSTADESASPAEGAHGAWEFHGTPRFEIKRRLGAGGFGVVFEAFDRERNARVALKALERHEAGIIYRFKQEFRALADLVHPNLVQLYELHLHDERWFFTMELVAGGDVVAFVRQGSAIAYAATQEAPRTLPSVVDPDTSDEAGAPTQRPAALAAAAHARMAPRFDEHRLRSAIGQLVEGLSALHDMGRLHRDIKPPNVLVGLDGRVVLVDFGLAVNLVDTSAGSVNFLAGTPVYMAPEQLRGDEPSSAWDWYGVGVLLFEALTGQLPFEGSLASIVARKQDVDPPAPSALVEGVPADLDRLCVDLLARAPAKRPGGREILERLGLPRPLPARARSAEPPFVGREAERRALAEAFHSMESGSGAVVALVGGPSGIGKSALVRRARHELREGRPDLVLLSGRCYEQESVPYKAIDGLIDPLSRYLKQLPPAEVDALLPADIRTLARLFPVLEQVESVRQAPGRSVTADARELRRRAFRALRELVARLGRRAPLVLFIDDLQWGDAESGALLLELFAPPDPPPVLLIAAYRSDDVPTSPCLHTFLPALTAMRGPGLSVVEIPLDDLTDAEACALARALLPETAPALEELVAAVARESRGRPFFVDELARFSSDRPAPSRRGGQGAASLVSLDEIVRARVAELPDGPRRLLEVVAAAGGPVDRGAAGRAAGLGSDEPGAYNLLRSGRLVRRVDAEGRDDIETYHDRIREVVTASLSKEARTAHFRSLAVALEGAGLVDAETLCVYFLEAGDRARAAELAARAAGDAARTLAFERAARLYRLALDLLPAGDPASRELHEKLGDALVNAGRGGEAAGALLAAVDGATPAQGLELRRRAAEQLLVTGHTDEGLGELRALLGALRIRLPDAPWQSVRWMAFHGVLLLLRGLRFRARRAEEIPAGELLRVDTFASVSMSFGFVDTIRGAYFAVRHAAAALAAGEPRRILRALSLIVGYGGGLGGKQSPGLVRRAGVVAAEIAHRTDDPHGGALIRMNRGINRVLRGKWRSGRADLEASLVTFREQCTGVTWELDTAEQFVLMALAWQGAWKQLGDRLPALLDDARNRGDRYAETTFSLYIGHVPHLLAGDPAAAERLARAAGTAWSQQRFNVQHYYLLIALTEIRLYEEGGRGPAAFRHLDGAWAELERSLLLLLELPRVEMQLLRLRALAALAAGDGVEPAERERAAAMVARLARRLGRFRVPWAVPVGLLARAIASALRGRREEVIASLEAAERGFLAVEMQHYTAAARRRRGELLGGEEGGALVAQADAWMRTQGAKDPARMCSMLVPGRWGEG